MPGHKGLKGWFTLSLASLLLQLTEHTDANLACQEPVSQQQTQSWLPQVPGTRVKPTRTAPFFGVHLLGWDGDISCDSTMQWLLPLGQASPASASRPTQQQYDLIHSFCHPPTGLISCTHRQHHDWPFTPFDERRPVTELPVARWLRSPFCCQETERPVLVVGLAVTSTRLDCRASGNKVHASMQKRSIKFLP